MKRNVVAWAALIVSSTALVSQWGAHRTVTATPNVPAESQKVAAALAEAYEGQQGPTKISVRKHLQPIICGATDASSPRRRRRYH